jgi:hypothetical protein
MDRVYTGRLFLTSQINRRLGGDEVGIGVGPGGGDALGASAGKLDSDHGLEAADEEEIGLGGGGNFELDEEADFFEAEEFGGDEEVVAEAGGFEVVDFGAGDDGDESGAAHLFEGPAERGGELGAGDFDHAEVGDVVDDSAGVGVEVVDFHWDGDAGLGGEGSAHVKALVGGKISDRRDMKYLRGRQGTFFGQD